VIRRPVNPRFTADETPPFRGPGIFRGDVDVCEGTRFKTEMLQTAVKEKE
jgi:hypothetical protein